MKVINTVHLPQQRTTSFYICKDNDASTVLFDTMSGYRFVSLSTLDREWQQPLCFETLEKAVSKLKELHDEKKEVAIKYKLQIVEITCTEVVKHDFYNHFCTDSQHQDARRINLFAPFEKFYASNSTEYTEGQLIGLRSTDIDVITVGYSDPVVNEAFNRYVELVESLPSIK